MCRVPHVLAGPIINSAKRSRKVTLSRISKMAPTFLIFSGHLYLVLSSIIYVWGMLLAIPRRSDEKEMLSPSSQRFTVCL